MYFHKDLKYEKRCPNCGEFMLFDMGEKDADIVRNIVLAWLSEKSFISSTAKNKKDKS